MLGQNRAPLAKLGGRILKDENTLWIKSLKQKYLHISDLLKASSSLKHPAFGRALERTILLVRKGACYLVGNLIHGYQAY